MDKAFGQFLTLNFKHQKVADTNLTQLPPLWELCYYRRKEDKLQKSRSHMRLGLVVAVSDPRMDGTHRCVFIQAKPGKKMMPGI